MDVFTVHPSTCTNYVQFTVIFYRVSAAQRTRHPAAMVLTRSISPSSHVVAAVAALFCATAFSAAAVVVDGGMTKATPVRDVFFEDIFVSTAAVRA